MEGHGGPAPPACSRSHEPTIPDIRLGHGGPIPDIRLGHGGPIPEIRLDLLGPAARSLWFGTSRSKESDAGLSGVERVDGGDYGEQNRTGRPGGGINQDVCIYGKWRYSWPCVAGINQNVQLW